MSAPIYGQGIEVIGRVPPEYARILSAEAVAFAARLQRAFGRRREELLTLRATRQKAFDAGSAARLSRRNPGDPRGKLGLCADSRRHSGSPRRDHRPGRPQDDHQRAQFGRERVHGRFRGRQHAELGQQYPGPAQPPRCDPARDRLRHARRQGVTSCSEKTATLFVRPRGWHLPEKHVIGRRQADLRWNLRLRAVLFPQRQGAARARQRTLFLSAQAREPPRGQALERHFHRGGG